MNKKALYFSGNLMAVGTGLLIGVKHGPEIGWAVFFIISVLVDIRNEVMK